MSHPIQHGYLLLADISGYTRFVAKTELEHSHEILAELLDLIIDHLTPALDLSQIDGDAVLVHAPANRFSRGETLLEVIETTYAAFRSRLIIIQRRTTCTCNACRQVTSLDLKFVAHFGEYKPHTVRGSADLLGLDVTWLRQRQIKDDVGKSVDWRGYAVFTEQCLAALNFTPPNLQALKSSSGQLGEISAFALNIDRQFADSMASQSNAFSVDESHQYFEMELSAPPPVVWEWLNDPLKRNQWMARTLWSEGLRIGGRTLEGAQNHCQHGNMLILETIMGWRPFEFFAVERKVKSLPMKLIGQIMLQATPEKHTLYREWFRINAPAPNWLAKLLAQAVLKQLHYRQSLSTLKRLVNS